MADIIERLDKLAPGDPPDDIERTANDAAAEIRRLRQRIRQAKQRVESADDVLSCAEAGV